MEASSFGCMQRDEADFSLNEFWASKAQMISRENPISRRYSASHIRSFREETRSFSFRSNVTLSSTASSPGHTFRDELIDPSTYSFTSALKALQARSAGYTNWECLSPEGFALNSKWDEAEKYICNPLSGEFPVECLSARTLSGRSFHKLTNRITLSAPLVYNSSRDMDHIQVKPSLFEQEDMDFASSTDHVSEKKRWPAGMTRDVGTQSTPPPYLSSSSRSPSSSPSITDDHSNSNVKSLQEVEGKGRREGAAKEIKRVVEEEEQERRRFRQGGCFSWVRCKRQGDKQTHRKNHIFSPHFKAC